MKHAAREVNALRGVARIDAPLDVARVRADFPILRQRVHGKPLVYLDNAATTQKPRVVIEAQAHYYTELNSNIHRGVHTLSQRATQAYEAARDAAQRFIHARRREEIVFVRGTTEAINLVATSYGARLQPGDEILPRQGPDSGRHRMRRASRPGRPVHQEHLHGRPSRPLHSHGFGQPLHHSGNHLRLAVLPAKIGRGGG